MLDNGADWLARVAVWIEGALTEMGYESAGPLATIQDSDWSRVLRVPTTAGPLYFKASAPIFGYEPALTKALDALLPGAVPHVLALDAGRHWMLMADAGTPFRDAAAQSRDLATWEAMFTQFARLQQAAIPHRDELLRAGCPDRRLPALPGEFAEFIADRKTLLVGAENGLPEDEHERLLGYEPEVRALCDELAAFAIPETLHHDDFGASNILVTGDRCVFYDWAESAITHPFCSLYIALRWARYVGEYDESALTRMRDAYLAAWSEYGSPDDLRAAFALAQRLATLSRALTWYRLAVSLDRGAAWERADAPAYWLRMFLNYPDEVE
ncbi:MAG TPA: aminoglycoside phosphotransferase family protein [Ktedonobacterales bacterium]|nr:aminoglycoside phosphotransferase family protein [Ktedonobacterales bacterium]